MRKIARAYFSNDLNCTDKTISLELLPKIIICPKLLRSHYNFPVLSGWLLKRQTLPSQGAKWRGHRAVGTSYTGSSFVIT